MKHLTKIIPFSTENNYYLYDCIGGNIYPCTEVAYLLYKNNQRKDVLNKEISEIREMKDSNDIFSKFSATEIAEGENLINELITNIKKGWIQVKRYEYPNVTKEDILKSLVLTKHLTFEVTNQCNLACTYCCYGDIYKKNQVESTANIENIISYVNTILNLKSHYNIGFENLVISFYGGEPLLRFDIIENVVNLVKSKTSGYGVTFSMTTNGVLLHKYIKFLVENKFKLLISLDGNEVHDSYRVFHGGKCSFELVNNNVLSIYDKYPDYFNQNINFSTVLHNKNECISVCDFFDKYNKIPSFSFLSKDGIKPSKVNEFNKLNSTHSYTDEEIKDISLSHPIVFNTLFSNSETKDILFNYGKGAPESFTEIFHRTTTYPDGSCFLFLNRAFIDINGYLYLCEKSNRKFRFGRIIAGKITIYTKRINKYYTTINSMHLNKCSHNCYKYGRCNICFFSDYDIVHRQDCICDMKKLESTLQNIILEEERSIYE